MPKKYECIVTPNKGSHYEICIWDEIEGFEEYDDLNKQLNKSEKTILSPSKWQPPEVDVT